MVTFYGQVQARHRIIKHVEKLNQPVFNNIPKGLSEKTYKETIKSIKMNCDKILEYYSENND